MKRVHALLPTLALAITVLSLVACAPVPAATATPAAPTCDKGTGQVITTASGLQYEDLVICKGTFEARPGRTVAVNYIGTLQDGTKFDSSYDRNQPFPFQLGAGSVIPGWDEGIVGMTIGSKRRLTIPPNLAYGPQGRPPVIPGNATLIFEVELVGVQ
ncbi:MAG: FKBP-type peptidyl-prolyl cis-trans isomerase [Chloroflexota bacterium]